VHGTLQKETHCNNVAFCQLQEGSSSAPSSVSRPRGRPICHGRTNWRRIRCGVSSEKRKEEPASSKLSQLSQIGQLTKRHFERSELAFMLACN